MTKRNKIVYWVATIWLALGMFSTAAVQLFKPEVSLDFAAGLGYPIYFLIILSIWKMLGVIAVLIPKTALIKEWAYAGFFFVMSGAIISHLVMGESTSRIFPSLLLLILTIVSWHFRPADRKVVKQVEQNTLRITS